MGRKTDAGTRVGKSPPTVRWARWKSLVADILCETGLNKIDVKTRTALELPGYYSSEEKWDLIVWSSRDDLVTAMEFKSEVGASFGNNFNHRSEEPSAAPPISG